MTKSRFDIVASQYDIGRPSYPDTLFDALEELSGTLLFRAQVADLGAGTGISTRALAARGAQVVAVDLGAQMLATLRARTPDAPAVLADGNQLPFADASFDLVTFAQSWHWFDPAMAALEIERVTRRGGAVAMWWNKPAEGDQAWHDAHRERLREAGQSAVSSRFDVAWAAIPTAFGRQPQTRQVSWRRVVSKEIILDEVASKSYVADLGPAGAAAFIERERAALPDGELTEPFVTHLAVIRFDG